ncbi:MAG: hypothetical protein ABI960_10815 [Candidatus Eisenbacteria bacterium]
MIVPADPGAATRAARPPLRLVALAILAAVLLAIGITLRPTGPPAGNRLVVVNAGSGSLDSVTVEPEPPGANLLAARAGYVAAQDSLWLALPEATGDTDVRVYRGGRVVANHAVYFGGQSIFEVRVGDTDQLGRYRRTDR